MNFECSFSLKHYLSVLDSAKESYFIGKVGDYPEFKKNEKFILLRHDVDFSVERAFKMAESESDNGLNSTYFILLHSQYYNALSKRNSSLIKKISDLGHEIGLHYDTSFLSKSADGEITQIKNEIKLLETIIDKKIHTVAPHVPSVTRKIGSDLNQIGLLDSMGMEISGSTTYISDSARYWRDGCMCRHVSKVNKLQILTHPIWWIDNKNRKDALKELIKEKQDYINLDFEDYKKMARELLFKLNTPQDQIDI